MERVYDYKEIRHLIKTGDLLAFGGCGFFSNVIKTVTCSDVSHVAGAMNSTLGTGGLVQLMESTSLGDGFSGVQITRLSDHIKKYDGNIWLYPLNFQAYDRLDCDVYLDFLLEMEGKEYDLPQALLSAADLIPDSVEDFEKLFCSELVYEAYERGGIVPPANASEMTPADLAGLDIYDKRIKIK